MKNTLDELKAKYRSVRVFSRTIGSCEYQYAEVYDRARRRSRQFSLGRAGPAKDTVKHTEKDKPASSTPEKELDIEEYLNKLVK